MAALSVAAGRGSKAGTGWQRTSTFKVRTQIETTSRVLPVVLEDAGTSSSPFKSRLLSYASSVGLRCPFTSAIVFCLSKRYRSNSPPQVYLFSATPQGISPDYESGLVLVQASRTGFLYAIIQSVQNTSHLHVPFSQSLSLPPEVQHSFSSRRVTALGIRHKCHSRLRPWRSPDACDSSKRKWPSRLERCGLEARCQCRHPKTSP